MKVKRKKYGCRLAVWRVFVIPLLVGLLVGFGAVAVAFHIGQRVVVAQSLPTPVPTTVPLGPTRLVVLLLDGADEEVLGVWQWWSDVAGNPGKAACVLSSETRIAPSGRTVGEIMRLAMAAGDDAWIARNTQDFASDCLLGQTSATDHVILVSQPGMIRLVDALGGIRVEGRQMDGVEAWNYLASPTATPSEAQRRQQTVWIALKAAAKRAPRPACEQIGPAENLYRSVPVGEDPCQQLETLLRQTPPYIATP